MWLCGECKKRKNKRVVGLLENCSINLFNLEKFELFKKILLIREQTLILYGNELIFWKEYVII